tara:strand:+ start:38 stop:829 length:792 start_codon:yes stop_codon:yes gene_type:complete
VNSASIEKAAEILATVRIDGGEIQAFDHELRPSNEADAYKIQDCLHKIFEDRGHGSVVGYKIGCTTAVMQKFLQINNPCAGSIIQKDLHHNQGIFSHPSFRRVGVECEIAVRLKRPLGFDCPIPELEEMSSCVASMLPAIEVVDDRYQNYELLGAPTLIADDFFHSACVVGKGISSWKHSELGLLKGVMTINGTVVGSGLGSDIMGHPLGALRWMARLFQSRGKVIEPGQVVLLGSVVETKWVEPGDTVQVEIDQLGKAKAHF